MTQHAVEISAEIIAEAKALTRKRGARAAIESAVAQLREYVHEPTPATARTLRSRKRGKTFSSADEAIAYLKGL
ncbi:MAG TPA: hypothetical protein VMB48_11675 [Steroidobacteraceae bacterium]|nr:hypothetical protein [Steroidobacteraceae bacterium]